MVTGYRLQDDSRSLRFAAFRRLVRNFLPPSTPFDRLPPPATPSYNLLPLSIPSTILYLLPTLRPSSTTSYRLLPPATTSTNFHPFPPPFDKLLPPSTTSYLFLPPATTSYHLLIPSTTFYHLLPLSTTIADINSFRFRLGPKYLGLKKYLFSFFGLAATI